MKMAFAAASHNKVSEAVTGKTPLRKTPLRKLAFDQCNFAVKPGPSGPTAFSVACKVPKL